MVRIRRVVAVGCPHPIRQRGNFRRDLFFDDEDRQTYLALLAGHAAGRHPRILGYCLMSNPIHLIAVPTRKRIPFHEAAVSRQPKSSGRPSLFLLAL
ncbi:MAG: hypothetical protein IT169_17695 [Bryobacterales bacterium]|nr:hypothetical protein [Bryobacterales bacterium]